ncbi:putrescine hydroxycinnamoyltransferase 1-like [Lolium rigidum]|uniref:putrescine hydroxycinnamoyltransferase 1-like n=1 Tax=Lolium rigidum TaxID=89674 RepID=UPI001F5C3778|nr:putrescine hydroxycinnamoyltransferase 1-like [Lolium rigidum]XP_047083182.1 putrescine hydroxycinnamoyltransferase 1-like [Lolium rigidum]
MKVEMVESTLVAPSEETPRQALWLSNFDVTAAMTHTALVYYYPAPTTGGEGFFSPDRLMAALAKALVLFYPLAGRLGMDEDGRLQIDCHGEGALYVVARADCTGEDLFSNYVPSPKVRRVFVPVAPSGDPPCLMAMFQVTFLKCGGVVLGTAIHHALMDGIGAFHFIQTWSGLARGLAVAEACPSPPSHDRTLLQGRSPPHADFHHSAYSSAHLSGLPRPCITLRYSVSPKLLADLKSQCAPGVSTYGAVTAHLWRCMCIARGLASGSDTHLRVTVNVRHRLCPPVPRYFSGNAILRDLVTVKVADVLSKPLGYMTDAIKKSLEDVDDAYVRSMIDYLGLESDKGSLQVAPWQLLPESDLWVTAWLGLPVYDADFGWGAPRLVAPAQMFGTGMAYVMQQADRDKGFVVFLALEPQYVPCFEDVFYNN